MKIDERIFAPQDENPAARIAQLRVQYGNALYAEEYKKLYEAFLAEMNMIPNGRLKSSMTAYRLGKFPYHTDKDELLQFSRWLEDAAKH